MDFMKAYELWSTDPFFDEGTRNELIAIKDDTKEIEDRFYRELEFGTGGLRGVIGAGTNRMNIYTVHKATQGLANYIIKAGTQAKGVVIAYDCRRMGRTFADIAATCLAANGIKAYVFDELRPTPELSFAVRELHCTAGINVTASHNPPEYNGYKVYWEDGAQVTPPNDTGIIAEVNAIASYDSCKSMSKEDAIASGMYEEIGSKIDDRYMEELKKQIIHPEIIEKTAKDLKIVYTPLCGAGNKSTRRILDMLGFENLYVVPEQTGPDPEFTTLDYPNPEDPKAFTYALRLAEEKHADIVLATDPDADRLGIYAYDTASGTYKAFTGNMSGMLIAEYILRERTKCGTMPKDPALVSTIVTTNMAKAIAEDYGLKFIEVLTGFKYIGEQIKLFEQNNTYNYVFGLEESYGCLAGTHARDKDAIVAVMCLCEVAAYCKSQGITLYDQMLKIYAKYGYYKESQYTITLKGADGARKIQQIMTDLRNDPPKQIGKYKVLRFRDYKEDKVIDYSDNSVSTTGLPNSNVLYFELEDDCWCCARPSGTEPKLKFYIGVKGTSLENSQELLDELTQALKADIKTD